MKNKTLYLLVACFLMANFSCKRDYDGIDNLLIDKEQPEPNFYIQGIINDLENNERVAFSQASNEIDLTPILVSDNQSIFSTSYSCMNNGKLSLNSITSSNRVSSLGCTGLQASNCEGLPTHQGIVLVLNTDFVYSEDKSLPREELYELLSEKEVFNIGTESGLIDIVFHHPHIEGYGGDTIDTQTGYQGRAALSEELDQSSVRVIDIQDFLQTGVEEPRNGFIVTTSINCSLTCGQDAVTKFRLEDVEAVFFFEYE